MSSGATAARGARRAGLVLALAAVAAVVGLLDAVYLTWDHLAVRIDPDAVLLCGPGEGCEISRFSPWSELPLGPGLPGLPIALLGAAFYAAVLTLLGLRLARPDDRRPRRLLVGMSFGAVGYSAMLALITLRVQEGLCPFCAVLYVVNVALLILAVLDSTETPLDALWGFADAAFSTPAAIAMLVFATIAGAGYAGYAAPLWKTYASRESRLLAEAQNIRHTPVLELDLSGQPARGPADAPLTLVEFADFECPHCQELFEAVHEVESRRPGQLRTVFVNVPLDASCHPGLTQPFHLHSCRLARAAECAHAVGKFWELAPFLYERKGEADGQVLLDEVARLGMSAEAFSRCMDGQVGRARVAADITLALALEVRGTPVFFLGGHRVVGAREASVIETMMDALLGDVGGAEAEARSGEALPAPVGGAP